MKQKSIKGLAGLATLLNRADLDMQRQAPAKRERRDTQAVYDRTVGKIAAAIGLNVNAAQQEMMCNYLKAGLREAYNLGHADALEQNSQVERLLEQQYEARTRVTMPAVVAAVMEQTGMSKLTIDLDKVGTVFQRNRIEHTLSDANVIEYTLHPAGEDIQ